MQNSTPLFPGFHLSTLRKKPRSARQVLEQELAEVKQKSLSQLSAVFGRFIPSKYLAPSQKGGHSRRRIYSKENIFWTFLSQILDADGGCKEAVRKIQAIAASKAIPVPSSSTAAYCKARKKLDHSDLREILEHTSVQKPFSDLSTGLNNRRVVVVDGTGLSMPDTPDNQHVWPQQKMQKPGCGFPQATVCACFCLQTGSLLSYRLGNKKSSELPLLREQKETFSEGDIFLGDKGFSSYFDIHNFQEAGIDSVVTLARRKPISTDDAVKVLSENDLIVKWNKPKWNNLYSYSREEWARLPEELLLRQIKVVVDNPGFRTKHFFITTTLLDSTLYPASAIAELYFRRWDVELFFKDIKETMGMGILRCKTAEMIKNEITMFFIAYNCIRRTICESAKQIDTNVRRISFKGSVQAIRQWEPLLNQVQSNGRRLSEMLENLYIAISNLVVPEREGRREPRCIKRRPKNYQLMTKPRREMIETPHRGRYRAKQA